MVRLKRLFARAHKGPHPKARFLFAIFICPYHARIPF
ncbi:hypothetical protein JOE11_003410 [Robbsia andropogonis]